MDPALTSLLFLILLPIVILAASKAGKLLATIRQMEEDKHMDTPITHPDFTPEQAARAIAVWSVTTLLAANHAELGAFGFDAMAQKKANFILHGQHVQNYNLRED